MTLGRTVGELFESMTSAEFSEWCVFYGLEPWGTERDAFHTGLLASTMVRVAGGKAANDITPAHFIHNPWVAPIDPDELVELKVSAFMAQF